MTHVTLVIERRIVIKRSREKIHLTHLSHRQVSLESLASTSPFALTRLNFESHLGLPNPCQCPISQKILLDGEAVVPTQCQLLSYADILKAASVLVAMDHNPA